MNYYSVDDATLKFLPCIMAMPMILQLKPERIKNVNIFVQTLKFMAFMHVTMQKESIVDFIKLNPDQK